MTAPALRYQSPLPHFLAGVLLVTLLTAAAFELWYRWFDGARRNPHFRRAWVEHVLRTPPARPGEQVILLISHSQGWGREVTDAQTYASLLETELRARTAGSTIRVVNWSVPAGRASEFIVLAAAAHLVRPTHLLLVASPIQFRDTLSGDGREDETSAVWASDAYYLLGYGAVRRLVSPDFRQRFVGFSDRLDILLGRAWPGWRVRGLPAHVITRWDRLKPFAKNDLEPTWFPPREHHRIIRDPLPPARLDGPLVNDFLRLASAAAPRATWITTPVHSRWRAQEDPSLPALQDACRRHGVDFRNATAAIPDPAFFTASHFDPEGHRLMARYLAEMIAP
jgi:hypothetical protein